jgi:hypothetical protein
MESALAVTGEAEDEEQAGRGSIASGELTTHDATYAAILMSSGACWGPWQVPHNPSHLVMAADPAIVSTRGLIDTLKNPEAPQLTSTAIESAPVMNILALSEASNWGMSVS